MRLRPKLCTTCDKRFSVARIDIESIYFFSVWASAEFCMANAFRVCIAIAVHSFFFSLFVVVVVVLVVGALAAEKQRISGKVPSEFTFIFSSL